MAKLQGLFNTNKISLSIREFLFFGIPLFLFCFISYYKSISDAYYLWFITPFVCLIITYLYLYKISDSLQINWVILSYLLLHSSILCFRNQIFLFKQFIVLVHRRFFGSLKGLGNGKVPVKSTHNITPIDQTSDLVEYSSLKRTFGAV